MKLFFLSIAFALVGVMNAQNHNNLNKDGVILEGYDPVSFFQKEGGVKGNPEFKYEYEGAIYYFSSKENKNLFRRNPNKYKAQYGGWCAYAIAKGQKAEIDISTGVVINDKLYFNYNKTIAKKFAKKSADYIKKADQIWASGKLK